MEENNNNSAADLQDFSLSIDQLGKSTFFSEQNLFFQNRQGMALHTNEGRKPTLLAAA